MRIAVIGAGAWGTALSDLLVHHSHEVVLWAHEADVAADIERRRENHRFLPGIQLHEALRATTQIAEASQGAEMLIYVAPSHVLRGVVRASAPHIPSDATVVIATKGIEPESLALMHEVVQGEAPLHPVVALSGPSFALEVARGQPTAVVAASEDATAASRVQLALSSASFRVYTNDDITGVELGGSLKNVIAVATGIAEGLELGLNSRAALITRGLAEMTRLGVALGARAETFAGLAGMGDLVLTCTGALSRNRAVGLAVGQGKSLDEVLAGRESVAEGVLNARSALELARRVHVELPIVCAVHRVLFERHPARAAIADLMTRELRAEHDR